MADAAVRDVSGLSEAAIRAAFRNQAEACAALGSPFTAALCAGLADRLDRTNAFGRRVLDWRCDDPGPSGDSVPLRACGALHALVLAGVAPALGRAYPPNVGAPDMGTVLAAIAANDDWLAAFLDSPPQTNETARAGAIWPMLALVAGRTGLPIRLLEVGASAGLNLRLDGFRYDLGGVRSGPADGGVRIAPDWRGAAAPEFVPEIVARAGCDIAPVDPTDPAQALRLRAYCWPDQAERRARLEAAIELAARASVPVVAQDAVAFLRERLAEPVSGVLTVVFSTVAWQYLPAAARETGEAVIEEAGARATTDAPLAWVRMEADGATPGAGLTLRLWPHGQGRTERPGRADFHGRWVDWRV